MSNEIGEAVNLLTVGLHHAQLYFPDHPRVLECAASFARRADEIAGRSPDGAFSLGVVDGRLVHQGRVLLGPTLTAKRLIDAASRLRCGGFRFPRGSEPAEILALLTVCAALRGPVASLAEASELLRSRGAAGISLSEVGSASAAGAGSGGPGATGGPAEIDSLDAETLARAVPRYQDLLEMVEVSHAASGHGRTIDTAGARGMVEKVLPDLLDRPAVLLGLARYPDFDSYTVGHSVRVALLAVLVGSRFGFPRRTLVELGAAGLLHDVGKGRIPDAILMKQGPLDDDERRVMKTHPVLGAEVLLAAKDVPAFAVAAAWGHHLRHDGSGYPGSAQWARRSRVTALVQVCDVFEALTAVRPYKRSFTPRRALGIMLEESSAYDPSAFRAFVSAIGFYPPGCCVCLSDGSEAFVLRAGEHPGRPVVEVRRGPDGRDVPLPLRTELDLGGPGAPRVTDLAEDDLVSRSAAPAEEGPKLPAHALIEAAGACPSDGAAEAGHPA